MCFCFQCYLESVPGWTWTFPTSLEAYCINFTFQIKVFRHTEVEGHLQGHMTGLCNKNPIPLFITLYQNRLEAMDVVGRYNEKQNLLTQKDTPQRKKRKKTVLLSNKHWTRIALRITDNPLRGAETEGNLTLLCNKACRTHYVHVLKVTPTGPQVRGHGSTLCPMWFILNSPGSWVTICVSSWASSKGKINFLRSLPQVAILQLGAGVPEGGLSSPTEPGRQGTMSLMVAFQPGGSLVLEKRIPGSEAGRLI